MDCSGSCGIDQKGIENLTKIKSLNASNNPKINNVNHLANTIEELDCKFLCGIDDYGIKDLKNVIICSYGNFKIKKS